jgi:hypothetical protein
MRTRFSRALFAVTLLASTPLVAEAQTAIDRIGGGGFNQFGGGKPAPPTPKTAPPPALPGAASTAEPSPASRPPTDMEPTDALFDAINRGDIGTARDAISRGADLHGHNLLGMTPIELSIDLGRNDISFMLLSMRGPDNGRAGQAAAPKAAAKLPAARQARQPPPSRAASVAVSAPAASRSARLYSADGGTPNPNAGFLGFDFSRR